MGKRYRHRTLLGSTSCFTLSAVLLMLPSPMSVAESLLFFDDFARADSLTLGSPELGGSWTQGNQQFNDSTQAFIGPGYTEIAGGQLGMHYINPAFVVPLATSTFGPYAFAPLTATPISNADLTASFKFTPGLNARVGQEFGFTTATSTFVSADPGLNRYFAPTEGVGIQLSNNPVFANGQVDLTPSPGT